MSGSAPPRSAWLVAAAVAAVVVVIEAPVVLAGYTWADRGYQTEVVPARAAAAEEWASGRLPEWWDRSGLGVPLAAEPSHGAMDPALALVGVAPDPAPAIDLLVVLHLMLAAIGVAIWARRRGAGEIAAAVAGAGLAASGALHAALLAGGFGVAWLPWAAWAAEGVAVPDDGGTLAGIHGRARLRRAVLLAVFIGAAGLAGPPIAAIDAMILAVAIVVGARGGAVAASIDETRRALLAVAAACAAGAAACAMAWLPAIVHRATDVAATGAVAPDGARLLGWLAPAGAPGLHLGAAWLALAVIGVVGVVGARRRRGPIVIGAAAIAIGALAWGPAMTWADPAIAIAALSAIVCALGAAGLDRLGAAALEGLDRRAAAILGAAAVIVAAALSARHAGAIASLGELASIAALALAWSRGGVVQLLTAVLVIGPAVLALRESAPLVARATLAARPLLAPAEGVRVYRPHPMDGDDADPAQRARDDHATLAGDVASRFAAATAQTPDPGRRAIEDEVWHAAGLAGGKLFDRYAIDDAILPATVAEAMQATPIAQRGRWALVDVAPRRPRAYVVRRVRGARSIAEEAALTFPGAEERGIALDTVVIAGAASSEDVPSPIARCTRRADDPARVVVECAHAPAGWAVIDDAWAPGWSATVDGEDAPVRRADALVRAVEIAAGDREIVWRYRAPMLRAGLAISGLAWLHLAFFAWLARRRRYKDGHGS